MGVIKRKAIVIVTLIVVALVAVCVWLVYSGVYNVAATKQHPAIEGKLLSKVMVASVRYHARDIQVPTSINLHDRALAGKTQGYQNACRTCHGAPGVKPDVWVYLYPTAPDLTRAEVVDKWSDAELYWIIKNGIEHTGMIGLGPTHPDEEIWAVTAFVRQLPTMSPAEYQSTTDKHVDAHKDMERSMH